MKLHGFLLIYWCWSDGVGLVGSLPRDFSGTGTNLKVGGGTSGANVGAPIRRKAPEKIFLVVPLHFLALKAQLVVLVSAFMMVSTVRSVSCLLFFYSRCPPCPAICKSGGHVPRPCPWSRRHCQRDWAQVRERLPAKTDVLTTERRRQPWITTVVQNLCAFKRLFCVMCHRRRRLRRRVVWSRATVSSWRRCRTFPAPVSTTTPDISTSSSSAKRRPSARFLRLRSFFLSLSFAAVCDLFKHFAILVILYVNVQQISWGLTLTVLGVS